MGAQMNGPVSEARALRPALVCEIGLQPLSSGREQLSKKERS